MRKIGNDKYWAELPDGHGFGQGVEIWQNIGLGQSEVIAVASDKFSAMTIVEALIKDV
jgi:hypothetical protein